jgi:hypothetical protein
MAQESEVEKTARFVRHFAIGIIIVVIVVGLIVGIGVFWVFRATATAKLVITELQYTDNRTDTNAPFLQITGYVDNAGTAKANNCTIHVNAMQSGNVTAIDTSATIPSLDAGASEPIDLQFPYTGQALVAYSSSLTWTN